MKSGLVKLNQWEDDAAKYVVLGDKATNGQSYAECIIVPANGREIYIPPDWRDQVARRIIEWKKGTA